MKHMNRRSRLRWDWLRRFFLLPSHTPGGFSIRVISFSDNLNVIQQTANLLQFTVRKCNIGGSNIFPHTFHIRRPRNGNDERLLRQQPADGCLNRCDALLPYQLLPSVTDQQNRFHRLLTYISVSMRHHSIKAESIICFQIMRFPIYFKFHFTFNNYDIFRAFFQVAD